MSDGEAAGVIVLSEVSSDEGVLSLPTDPRDPAKKSLARPVAPVVALFGIIMRGCEIPHYQSSITGAGGEIFFGNVETGYLKSVFDL